MTDQQITVKKIVKEWLEQNGYDGLAGDECGCKLDELCPCDDGFPDNCVAGHLVPCPCEDKEDCEHGGDCGWNVGHWHIQAGKKEKEAVK